MLSGRAGLPQWVRWGRSVTVISLVHLGDTAEELQNIGALAQRDGRLNRRDRVLRKVTLVMTVVVVVVVVSLWVTTAVWSMYILVLVYTRTYEPGIMVVVVIKDWLFCQWIQRDCTVVAGLLVSLLLPEMDGVEASFRDADTP